MEAQQILKNNSDLLPDINDNTRKLIFILCLVLCLTPFISPALALLLGLVVAQLTGHP